MDSTKEKLFKKVYDEYYNLHPSADSLPKSKYYYLHRQWFFSNHIDLVLENIKNFCEKYYPNLFISSLAIPIRYQRYRS